MKTIGDTPQMILKEMEMKRKSSMFASKVDRFRGGSGEDQTSNRSGDSKERIEMGFMRNNAQRTMLLLNDYKSDEGDKERIFKKQSHLHVVPENEAGSNQISFI